MVRPRPLQALKIDRLRGELLWRGRRRRIRRQRRRILHERSCGKSREILAEICSCVWRRLRGSPRAASDGKRSPDVRSADTRLVSHINNLQEQLYAERNHNRRLKGGR